MREVFNTIRGNAICFPDRLAIVLPDEKITYGELWRKISIAWTKVNNLGMDREKPVVLLIENPIIHTIIRFALMCAGYSIVAIRHEHISLIWQLKPEVMFCDIEQAEIKYLSMIFVNRTWIDGSFEPVQYHSNLHSNRIGTIVFTTGSTGVPKAIGITFTTLEDGIKLISNYRKPFQRIYMAYGLSTHGLGWLPRLLTEASTIFFTPGSQAINLLSDMKIQEIICSPSQIQQIIKSTPHKLRNIKIEQITLQSAPLSNNLKNMIQKTFKSEIVRIYNSTEALAIAIAIGKLNKEDEQNHNVFVPISFVEIVDGHDNPVPAGTMGRIKIHSSRISHKYEGSLQIENKEKLPGFFISNDLGFLTAEGMLVLSGRADETINFGGAKFAPEIPEEIFSRHPLIADAGVVAVRAENQEQEVWVALVAPSGIDVNLLNQWYAQNTSGEMRSMHFHQCFFVDQIPRGLNGKVLRQQLRDKLIATRDRLKTLNP